ncbi:MAG: aldo/keto reductase [Actinomycetales bacterium]|nr:aldo/keto reductase [Actinomycetales bacterium]
MITLPKTNLDVYPLCLGGNVFGFSADVTNSEIVLNYYFDNGGNFIDTADMYSQWAPGHVGGESETIIGNWMKRRGNRKEMVIATKVAKLDTRPGLKNSNIIAACDDSLRRLQTDYIDIYYAHQDDSDTPIEETLSTFDSLIKSGKVRYIAASNFTSERLQESLDISKANNLASYIACQDQYNLMDRDYETTLRDTVEKNGLSEIPYYGLARGFLSGKYRPGVTVESVRATGVATSYANERGWTMLEKLDQIAKEKNTSVSAIALAWLRQQKTVSAPIASATKREQITELMPIVELNTSELQRLTNS